MVKISEYLLIIYGSRQSLRKAIAELAKRMGLLDMLLL